MLRFFQQFFRSKSPQSLKSTPVTFSLYAQQAITLITASDGQLVDDQVVSLLEANGIPVTEAVELLLFLPTAFCRHMLPQVNWPNYYLELIAENRTVDVRYSTNHHYEIILIVLQEYLTGNFTKEDFLKIAGRSASFKAINHLLKAGGKLEDVSVSPEVIAR